MSTEDLVKQLSGSLSGAFHSRTTGDVTTFNPEGCPVWAFGFSVGPTGVTVMPEIVAEFGDDDDWSALRLLLLSWQLRNVNVVFRSEGET